MRIIAGAWRGRTLSAPPGPSTRPTADRVRQALFDRLLHAPWARDESGRPLLHGAAVLDVFAGTGALGLEALSRGAAHATFMENDRTALAALRANIAACRAEPRTRLLPIDARNPPPAASGGPGALCPTTCSIVFLDPPYHQALAAPTLAALQTAGWLAPAALLIIEHANEEPPPPGTGSPLAQFTTGPATLTILRHPDKA